MDQYGEGLFKIVFVNEDGFYIDISKEELKKYRVVKQNIEPNTEMKYTFEKDDDGEEYDSLVDSQNIEEIELYVTQVKNDQNK